MDLEVAKAVLTFSTGMLAGLGTTVTFAAVPSMLEGNDPLPTWRKFYERGRNKALLTVSLSFAAGTWCYFKEKDWRYLLAAGLAITILPYTFVVMKGPVNDKLFAIHDKDRVAEDARVRQLIKKWEKCQYVRTALGLGAFSSAIWVMIK